MARTRRRTRPPHRASSMDVDARLTPPDPPGKPAAPAQPGSPELRAAPGCGTIAFRESDRPADPRADERNGDEAQVRDRAVLAAHPMASKRPQV
jgi:hypothetical protein